MRINKIHVKYFKALFDADFEPGNVNVLIGANGAGKSTVLEALGILSAAMSDRVNDNSLQRMGVRLSPAAMYKSRFKTIERAQQYIEFEIQWTDGVDQCSYTADLMPPTGAGSDDSWKYLSEFAKQNGAKVMGRSNRTKAPIANDIGYFMLNESMKDTTCRKMGEYLSDYAIFQPETPILRGNISDPLQASPLGLGGGRLPEAVGDLLKEEDGEFRFGDMEEDDILSLIDWADAFYIDSPKKSTLNAAVSSSRNVIEFKDRYLKNNASFTGYDASEGALYVLFMLTLAMHPASPVVFSIDNFDHALNPRLVRRLTEVFCEKILEREKTVFLTTHNPFVLDGLNLNDDRIRLFSINRDSHGYATLERVQVSDKLIKTDMPLSRLWIEGYFGGVPDL